MPHDSRRGRRRRRTGFAIRARHGRAGFGRGHREVHHGAAVRQPVGRLRARLGNRPVADEVPRPRRRRGRRAVAHLPDLRILSRAREGDAPRQGGRPRQIRGRPRHPARRHRRRGGHPRPRPAQEGDRRARGSAHDDAGTGRADSSRPPGRSITSTPASTRPRRAAPRWSWSSPTASRSRTSR